MRPTAISERLAARDPANTQWQRDLSVSHNNIGDVLTAQGDLPAALAAYRKELEITERLAARDPGNIVWQHDLVVSFHRMGTAAPAAEALPFLERALSVLERLENEKRALPDQRKISETITTLIDQRRSELSTAKAK